MEDAREALPTGLIQKNKKKVTWSCSMGTYKKFLIKEYILIQGKKKHMRQEKKKKAIIAISLVLKILGLYYY